LFGFIIGFDWNEYDFSKMFHRKVHNDVMDF